MCFCSIEIREKKIAFFFSYYIKQMACALWALGPKTNNFMDGAIE